MKEARLQLRIDPALKKQALQVARRKRYTLSSLVTLLLQQVVETDKVERSRSPSGEVDQV
jgi:antitoxin component of RelBE/YafQ-DinJ toxin-antitoxin module